MSIRSSMISFRSLKEPPADGQKAHRGQRLGIVSQGELVGGELLEDERVERQVGVEGGDHVVAVGERERIAAVLLKDVPLGVGVPGDVQPVSPPALAVPRRGQQPVDQPGVGVGGRRRPRTPRSRRRSAARPARSSDARRISVRRSTAGDGVMPSASSFARIQASIGVFTQPWSLTVGGGVGRSGWNAQWVLAESSAVATGRRLAPRRARLDPFQDRLERPVPATCPSGAF